MSWITALGIFLGVALKSLILGIIHLLRERKRQRKAYTARAEHATEPRLFEQRTEG